MKINSSNDANRDDRHALSCVWREVQSVPASSGCPRTRFKHAACIHGNHVYICSGKDSTSPLKDIWRYHLGSGRWERLTYRGETLPHLEGHTVVSHRRLLLVFGGEFTTGTSEPPLWILNTDQQVIHRPCADVSVPQPTGRRDHSALVHCGIMYVYGGFVDLRGSSSELWGYHIDDDYWKLHMPASTETPGGRHGHSCVAYRNNMWIYGGLCDLTIKAELWTFNFLSERWQKVRCVPAPPPMTGHSANVVKDHMVVVGGENQGELHRDIWIYAFDFNMWRKITLHNSPHQPLPCSQHATVCVINTSTDESGDNSARCFSEPTLQSPVPSKISSVTTRPRTSPSTESTNVSASKWVYPVNASSRNCDILSLELLSLNSADIDLRTPNRISQVLAAGPPGERKVSAVSTVSDDRPLLRFVSRDSNDSYGIDNVIDCTADEQYESNHELSKMCSTTGLCDHAAKTPNAKEQYSFVNNFENVSSISIEPPSHFQNESNVKPSSLTAANMTNQTQATSRAHQHNRRDVSPSSYSTQHQKAICSRYCDDLFIEDIEQDQLTSPESVRVGNPFTYTKEELDRGSRQQDWVELESFSSNTGQNFDQQDTDKLVDVGDGKLGSVTKSHKNVDRQRKFETNNKELPPQSDHDTPYKKVLVTVATQTGSNLDLRPGNAADNKDVNEKESLLFLDGAPFLLVFGGKVNKGHVRQQPIKVWRCDINV